MLVFATATIFIAIVAESGGINFIVRGFISYAVISTPLVLLYLLLVVLIPVSEGLLTYGAAAIIGIPLVWYLNSIG